LISSLSYRRELSQLFVNLSIKRTYSQQERVFAQSLNRANEKTFAVDRFVLWLLILLLRISLVSTNSSARKKECCPHIEELGNLRVLLYALENFKRIVMI